jgi:thiol:disulfide interchange protein DsbD
MLAILPLFRTALIGLGLLPAAFAMAAPVSAEHLRIDLVAESSALVPGRTAWLGLHLRHDPHWHTYWINPGDSGLPTRLSWQLPEGYGIDPIDWPAPTRFEVGGLYNFGYDGDTLLPVALHVPASARPGDAVDLKVEAKWLICEEECIPGKAELHLPMAIARDAIPGPAAALFARARATTPQASDWTGSARIHAGKVDIRLDGKDLPAPTGLDVFAVQRRVLDNAPPLLRREGEGLHIQATQNDYFDSAPAELDLVLTSTMTNGAAAAWRVRVPLHAAGSTGVDPADISNPEPR